MNNVIMDIEEVSLYLNLSKSTIYKLAQENRIPCQKVGRHWRFKRSSIDQWLDGQGKAPKEPVETRKNPVETPKKPVETPKEQVEMPKLPRMACGIQSMCNRSINSASISISEMISDSNTDFNDLEKKILSSVSIPNLSMLLIMMATKPGKTALADLLEISTEQLDQIASKIDDYINNYNR